VVTIFTLAKEKISNWPKSGPVETGPTGPVATPLQRGGEVVSREWNGEGALGVGGLSLHFCPGAPEFQVTPLPPDLENHQNLAIFGLRKFSLDFTLTLAVS